MKVKANLILKEIAGANVVLPIGAATVDFTGILTLNESGAMLWNMLLDGATRDELALALTREYEVELAEALTDVDVFIEKLKDQDCLEF